MTNNYVVFGLKGNRALKCGLIGLWALLASIASYAQSPAQAASSPIVISKLNANENIPLDGSLSHPAWQHAAAYDSFIERDPKNGAVPKQRTTVRVLSNERALYFGIEAFDTEPEKITAPMVRHDGVNRTQDFVVVYVDAVGARKAAQFFRVSASGSTADGLHTAENDEEDFSPDFDFDAAASINTQGYTAVFRIPFASLRYAKQSAGGWKVLIGRRLPREQAYLITSVLIPVDVPSFIATMQVLEGVAKSENDQFLTLRPTLALRRTTQDGVTENATKVGAEIKWRPSAEWVIDGTIQPDFSQVELDVPQLSRNTRFAQYLTEKRPFFLESKDLLQSPTDAIYTRSFTQPRWGARVSWRGDGAAGTGLVLNDEGGGSVLIPGAFFTSYAEQPAYQGAVMRVRKDESAYTLGMLASNRTYNNRIGNNTVLGIDSTWQIAPALKMRAQLLGSNTTAQANDVGQLQKGDAAQGNQQLLNFNYKTDDWQAFAGTTRTSRNYRNDSGFTSQSDARDLSANINRIWRDVDSPIGKLNEFWLYLYGSRTDWLERPLMISGYLTPGIYIAAARNTDFTLEYRAGDWARLSPGGTLHQQKRMHIEYGVQPAEWWPRFSLNADIGRHVDYTQDRLRNGVRYSISSQLRPHRLLEVEPQLSQVVLRADGQDAPFQGGIAYRESAAQLLSVLHLSATQKLRYIGQQTQFSTASIARDTRTTHSLTYSWRKNAGTVAYLGAATNRGAQFGAYSTKGTEWFAKLQLDPQELGWW
jgi:Domain of unknown function (DUF5916)